MVRPGRVEKEWAAVLGREQDKRSVAEYAVGTAWDPEDASRLVEDAAAFVQRMQDYLRSVGVTIEK
jgi:uncharacterized protein (UPF0332 family)